MQFYNVDDARLRLRSSTIYLEDSDTRQFYYVEDVGHGDEDYYIVTHNIETLEGEQFSLDEMTIPAQQTYNGYINDRSFEGLCYFSRTPERRAQMGLTDRNSSGIFSGDFHSDTSIYRSPALAKMLRNEYPPISECFKRELDWFAFDRSFALERVLMRGYRLLYRTEAIGEVYDGAFNLYPGREYLKECLTRAMKGESYAIQLSSDGVA